MKGGRGKRCGPRKNPERSVLAQSKDLHRYGLKQHLLWRSVLAIESPRRCRGITRRNAVSFTHFDSAPAKIPYTHRMAALIESAARPMAPFDLAAISQQLLKMSAGWFPILMAIPSRTASRWAATTWWNSSTAAFRCSLCPIRYTRRSFSCFAQYSSNGCLAIRMPARPSRKLDCRSCRPVNLRLHLERRDLSAD